MTWPVRREKEESLTPACLKLHKFSRWQCRVQYQKRLQNEQYQPRFTHALTLLSRDTLLRVAAAIAATRGAEHPVEPSGLKRMRQKRLVHGYDHATHHTLRNKRGVCL